MAGGRGIQDASIPESETQVDSSVRDDSCMVVSQTGRNASRADCMHTSQGFDGSDNFKESGAGDQITSSDCEWILFREKFNFVHGMISSESSEN